MYCPMCGAENKDDQHFCGNCGKRLPEIARTSGTMVSQSTQNAMTSDIMAAGVAANPTIKEQIPPHTVTVKPPDSSYDSAKSYRRQSNDSIYSRAWNGQLELWKVYWGSSLMMLIIRLVTEFILYLLPNETKIHQEQVAIATFIVLIPIIIFALWSTIAVWRCAPNAKWAGWNYIVRGQIVIVCVLIVAAIFYIFSKGERDIAKIIEPAYGVMTTAKNSQTVKGIKNNINGDGAKAAYDRGDYETALRIAEPLARQGDAQSQNRLGVMYRYGRGVRQDDEEAAKWYRKAADQGHAAAQFNLGTLYFAGRGVRQDDAEAAKWFRKAADQGYSSAQCNLGAMYVTGRGVGQDDVEAAKWYRKAADQGFKDAQKALDSLKERGRV